MIQVIIKKEIKIKKTDQMVEDVISKKGHTILSYPNNMPKNTRIELLENIQEELFFRLAFWEKGGGSFNGGEVQIVCDLNGFKMQPIYVVNNGWRANLNHALFIGQNIITIKLKKNVKEKTISCLIQQHTIFSKTGIYSNHILFNDILKNIYELPEDICQFDLAIEAAYEKIKDFECIKPYYV